MGKGLELVDKELVDKEFKLMYLTHPVHK